MGDYVDYLDNSRTGQPSQVIGPLKAQSSYFSKGATIEYIGMTSGQVESRMDDYKKDLGINEVRVVYETSSYKNAVQVEKELIDFSERNHPTINANNRDGGGGRLPEMDGRLTYKVYAAYRRNY